MIILFQNLTDVSCPDLFDLSVALDSCHKFSLSIISDTVTGVYNECTALHQEAHLVAIETQQEYDMIEAMRVEANCRFLWTGGFKTAAGQWFWNMGGGVSKSITYQQWKTGEPSGDGDYLLLQNGGYNDARQDLSTYKQLPVTTVCCYVCEYHP